MPRREFIKGTADAAAATLLPLPLASAQQTTRTGERRKFEVSSSHYAWEIHDEGVEKVLDNVRQMLTCNVRPLAYGIQPQINGNKVSFDLERPRYLILFFNDEPAFNNTGLLLFAEPPEKNPSKNGDPNVVNIQDYKVDSTGKTNESVKINQAISDVSSR